MHDTRLQVLEAIKLQQPTTVVFLAEALGISPISVRHHLTSLQAEGLIKIEIDRQGVGRPKHLYSLTEAAQRYFPNKYHLLAERLLDELKASLAPDQVEHMIDRLAANVASHYGTVSHGTLEDRLKHLVEILGEEGFVAEVQRVGNNIVLTELNCPYLYVGQRHPEVCRIDNTLIRSILGGDVQQTSCVLHGDRCCTFSVKDSSIVSAGEPASGG
jgi:DeoR family transcriptional regulator, suf operon transcriptional repressor